MPPYCWSAAMTFSPEGPYGTIVTGPPVEQANAAIILLHGRGQRAHAMLELARQLDLPSVAWLALQASAGAWYSPKYDGLDPAGEGRKGVVAGKGVIIRIDHVGRLNNQKKKQKSHHK